MLASASIPPLGERPPVWQKDRFEGWMAAWNEAVSFDTDTTTATMMAAATEFWIPLNLDFRGRVYGISHFNFAREDRVRGLFMFKNGAPIGVDGLQQLKAHVASTANGNRWSDEERPGDLDHKGRIAWTNRNLETLASSAKRCCVKIIPATLNGPCRRTVINSSLPASSSCRP
jgi:DNA-directed RNA polymerase